MEVPLKKKEKLKINKAQIEFFCRHDINIWSEVYRGFDNPPHIRVWHRLINNIIFGGSKRLCVLAPRDHAKSEVFAVNTTTYLTKYGGNKWKWVYIFCNTQAQANDIVYRIHEAIMRCYPEFGQGMKRDEVREKIYFNSFRITGRGTGASVRGAHPDLIIADDILDDDNSATNMSREKVKKWWFGTVTNMCKPTSAIIIEGTPQHELDLIMSLKNNAVYKWKRYPAEMELPDELSKKYGKVDSYLEIVDV